jgi:hypothetical protein
MMWDTVVVALQDFMEAVAGVLCNTNITLPTPVFTIILKIRHTPIHLTQRRVVYPSAMHRPLSPMRR